MPLNKETKPSFILSPKHPFFQCFLVNCPLKLITSSSSIVVLANVRKRQSKNLFATMFFLMIQNYVYLDCSFSISFFMQEIFFCVLLSIFTIFFVCFIKHITDFGKNKWLIFKKRYGRNVVTFELWSLPYPNID